MRELHEVWILCVLVALVPRALTGAEIVPVAERFTIASKTLGETRSYLVHVPEGFDPEVAYPVLVLLDGIDHLGYVSGVVDFLAFNQRIPSMLIVAVENADRYRDMTPRSADARTGGADRFLDFLADELEPEVERRFRTRPYRVLAGHSLAGMFTVYALLHRPAAFNGYLAMSPTLEWNEGAVLQGAREVLLAERSRSLDVFLSISDGSDEGDSRISAVRQLADWLPPRGAPEESGRGMRARFESYAGERHMATGLPSVTEGLPAIFDGWYVPDPRDLYASGGVAALERHYRALSARLGYVVPVPLSLYFRTADWLSGEGRHEEANTVLVRGVEQYPGDPFVHHALARSHAALGDREHAVEQLQIALRLDPGYAEARRMLEEYGIETGRKP